MTLPELPALQSYARDPSKGGWPSVAYFADSVRARESTLVAEIERLRAELDAANRVNGECRISMAELDAENARLRAEVEAMRWPDKPTPAMCDALRAGSRRDRPSDELCAVRYAALLVAKGAR